MCSQCEPVREAERIISDSLLNSGKLLVTSTSANSSCSKHHVTKDYVDQGELGWGADGGVWVG